MLIRFLDHDHPQGFGQMVGMPCKVKWNIYIPFNLEQIPYILITSHGIHEHPPPPPRKTPRAIVEGILDVLKRINDPNLTIGL